MKVWLNGNLVDEQHAVVSVFDHGLLYGDGVFEGIRVYGGRIFQCKAHLDRLFASADAIRLPMPYDAGQLEEAMRQAVEANAITDGYIRLVVTRGPGTLGLDPRRCHPPSVIIIADTVALYPREYYEHGMPVIIARTRRRADSVLPPRIKSLNYLNNIVAQIETQEAGVPEALMLNADGEVAEATGDNIFIVHNGQLLTPPPEAGILLGITRSVVMLLAERMGIAVRQKRLMPADVHAAQECFLTGTAAEIVAVTSVDRLSIGDGEVGPITRKLLAAFRDFTATDEQVPYAG
jgi:branched-chain amino acid aminotransferase